MPETMQRRAGRRSCGGALALLLPLSLLLCPALALAQEAAGQAAQEPADSGAAIARPLPRVTLKEAISRALERNPSLALARAEVERAEALVRQARAGSLPTLSSTLTYTRLDSDRIFGEGTAAARVIAGADAFSGNIALSVPLVHAQRWMSWSHARDNRLPVQASAQDARRLVAAATARSYLAVLAQKRVREVARRAQHTARQHVDFARRRLSGGTGNRLELIRAQVEAATSDALLQTSQGAMERSREALGVLLGQSGPVDVTDAAELAPGPLPAEALGELSARRPDLRALSLKVEAARKVARDSWTDFMPYITGLFQPFVQEPASLSQPQTGWQAQFILSLPLYDGGLRYGLHAERRALLAASRASLEAATRQARADVRSALIAIRQADKALAAARRAERLGNEAHALANEAYEAGATTNLEVIDAARKASDAGTAAVVAEDAARQARLELLIAAGRFP